MGSGVLMFRFSYNQRQGFWRAIADKVKEAKKRSMLHFPDEQLVYSTYHVLALMKLRSYAVAAEELAAIGDLKSKKFRYEHHGDMYPGKTGVLLLYKYKTDSWKTCMYGSSASYLDLVQLEWFFSFF